MSKKSTTPKEEKKNDKDLKKDPDKNQSDEKKPTEEAKKDESVSQKDKKKKKFSKKSLLILLLLLLPMICCATVMIFSYLGTKLDIHNSGKSNGNSLTDTSPLDIVEDHNISGYLGYEEVEIIVEDNTDFHDQLFAYYDNLEELYAQEELLTEAIEMNDAESFFDAYKEFNKTGSEMISQAESIDLYLSGGETEDSVGFNSFFVQPVSAMERSSLWYYVPIIGSLIKAKHQSIETARAGMYEYLKNELPENVGSEILSEVDLSSAEELRTASDSTIEYLARNTELRAGINWTKLSTEVGKQAVIATVEGYKIGSSATPVKAVGTGSAMRYFTEKGGPVADQIPDAGKRVTVAVPDDIKNSIDQADPGRDDGWRNWSDNERAAMTGSIAGIIEDGNISMTAQKSDANGMGEKFRVPPDTYDVVTVTNDTAPLIIPAVEVNDNKVTEVLVPYTGLEIYAIDPEIAMTLGFQLTPVEVDVEVTSCLDVGDVNESNEWDVDKCQVAYDSCVNSPREYLEGYSSCISAGGCWDIGRWEYVNENNCEIDSENNLNYDNSYFDEDFEYFPGGNLAYCECIVECRNEYSVERDCSGELRDCCDNVVD